MLFCFDLDLFSIQDFEAFQFVTKFLQISQILECFCCDLSEHYVSEIKERARSKGNEESTIAAILLTDTAQKARSIMG